MSQNFENFSLGSANKFAVIKVYRTLTPQVVTVYLIGDIIVTEGECNESTMRIE